MRWVKRIGLALLVGLGLLAAALGLWALLPPATAPIDGPDPVATIERVPLGGVEQTVLIRGADRSQPVLLFVHGGPGAGHMPLAPLYGDLLEQRFVVVHWDQRGAASSCAGVAPDAISLDRIVADAIELSEWLHARFPGPLVLLGHSWGSVVGTLAVQRRPDLYAAYVGVGQLVNGRRNEELSYRFVLDEAERRGDAEALAQLRAVSPPWQSFRELGVQRGWLMRYGGSLWNRSHGGEVLERALFGREYTLGTRLRFLGCFRRSVQALWPAVERIDFTTSVPRLEVPVFLFLGRHDYNTPFELARAWAGHLEAPRVEVVWFASSGHLPPIEEPEAFQRALIDRVRPVALAPPGAERAGAGAAAKLRRAGSG